MRRTREQWAALVAAFEKTKQPAIRFCATRGIAPKTFAWWRWHLRDTAPRCSDDGVKLLSVDVVENASAPSPKIAIAVSDVELRMSSDKKMEGGRDGADRVS
jgi:hypothetical protein